MFDLEQRDDVWRERREFLLDDAHRASLDAPTLPAQEAQRLAALAPANAPYCRVRALGGSDHSTPEHDAALSLRDALRDEAPTADAGRGTAPGWPGTSSDEIYEANGGEGAWDDEHREYAYLNADYDAAVNDAHDAGLSDDAMDEGRLRMGADAAALSELQKVLRLAAPLGVAAIARTQSHPAPLFTDFDRAAIITFAAPARLDHTRLEAALAGLVRRRLMLAGIDGATGAGWQWADATDAAGVGIVRRELVVPVVNWRIGYALTGRDLIVADDADLLREVAARAQTAGASASTTTAASTVNQRQFATLDELTLVDFTHQARDFRQTMLRLDAPLIKGKREKHERNEAGQPEVAAAADSEEFFSGNVASLLDAARVRAVRLTRRRPAPGRLHEELEYVLLPGVPTE